jgi:cellulose synthase/poly-beta-1,6-N-acetylglucosamine synthase-like glycosyltransferase
VSNLGAVLVALPVLVGLHAYIFYPLTLSVGARIAGTKKRLRGASGESRLPMVSIVIPAYNEEAQIRGSIESLFAQD